MYSTKDFFLKKKYMKKQLGKNLGEICFLEINININILHEQTF